ncbi:DEKNAAC102686 [Brettanomyces naardenensis]|uniref:Pre-mRNA-splicing factor PRP46 n=1 Tax=Brettanomyces naardenensis TaxID=13370 RepID=A0A448YK90_BRENA|nr:DEKNAAC102686 [Brettanomyces naardenensis]
MPIRSYDEVKREKSLLFDDSSVGSSRSSLNDQRSSVAFEKSITNLGFDPRNRRLPGYLERKLHKHQNILDKLRDEKGAGEDMNDLGLPGLEDGETSTALVSQATKSLTSLTGPTIGQAENAFANELIVPRLQSGGKSVHHSNWKLFRVLLGHTGQVTSLTFDPQNEFFATGSSDRTIKIWNLASGQLQLTLTGHIMAVRGLVISDRHPYMFSCSEDKTVKCWDLEKNKIVRDYHGHLSSVYSIDIHPTLDLIVTGGRDSSVKVWDIRSKLPVFTLTGHKNTVNKVSCRAVDPQIISCSMDCTVKTWDLVAGKCDKTLTYHSKSVRSFCCDNTRDEFISGSSDGLKKFNLPACEYLQELENLPHDELTQGNLILNTNCCNSDGVMFAGYDDGQYGFWDWESGTIFQKGLNNAVPGSLSSERGVLCSSFDRSGLRLVTGNVDKSVKVWKQTLE